MPAGVGSTQAPGPAPLRLSAPIATWDEAIPLGNGLLGGLLWGGGRTINLSLDRGDLWDLRPAAPFGQPGYTWPDLLRLVKEGKEDSLHHRFDEPYDNVPHPTKISAGRIVITLDSSSTATDFGLDPATAEGSVALTRGAVRGFFSATAPVALFRLPPGARISIQGPASLGKLGYRPGTAHAEGRLHWYVQDAALGLRYVVAAGARTEGDHQLLAVTVTSTTDGADPVHLARRRIAGALREGYDRARAPHLAWWRRFWAASSISVPDTAIQHHLELVRYFYGAASRPGAPPMPLQGVWTADEGNLPPWKGDFHNDLNTQLTYLAAHAAGLDDALDSWLDFNWKLRPAYQRFARDFYGTAGAAVPGVMAQDGQPLGGWAQYSLSPVMGAWVAQSFYLAWRYSMDPTFLRDRAYPFLADIGTNLEALLESGPDGTRRLPISSSPEIFDNSMKAWLPSPSNFDVALLRWLFGALDETATALGRGAEARRWHTVQSALPALTTDSTGSLGFTADLPYAESHRHFSHAMAIHPLGLLSPDHPGEARIINRTLDRIERFGPDWWTGYSYAWMSAMLARAGRGNEALRYLETYRNAFLLRNGFHANGDQTRSGFSKMTYRPFTLEGNFQALEAAEEMLLQSWGGVVRIFPAVSDRWAEASFTNLRAEGGFRVSARRAGGMTTSVDITAPRGGLLRLRDPLGPAGRWNRPVRREGNDLVVRLGPGQGLAGAR